ILGAILLRRPPPSWPISFAMPDQICVAIPDPPTQQTPSGVPELSMAAKNPGAVVLPPAIETSGTRRLPRAGTPDPFCHGGWGEKYLLAPPPEAPPGPF